MNDFLLNVIPGKASCDILEIFDGSDNADELGKAISENPRYLDMIDAALDEAISQTDKVVRVKNTSQLMIMLGVENVRKIICANQFYKRIHGNNPPEAELNDLTEYAQKLDEIAKSYEGERPKMAFLSGLIFDIIKELMKSDDRFEEKHLKWLDDLFVLSTRASRLATQYTDFCDINFTHKRFLFCMPFIMSAGKAILSFQDPNGMLEFHEKTLEPNLFPSILQTGEDLMFGINHSQYASLLAFGLPQLKQITPACLNFSHPYLIDRLKQDSLFQLASLSQIAWNSVFNLDNNFWIPDSLKEVVDLTEILKSIAPQKTAPEK